MRHTCRPPYPPKRQNIATLPLHNRPTNIDEQHQAPRPPGERKLNRARRRKQGSPHASPVALASSSRLTHTENQPELGGLQDRTFDLLWAPGPQSPEVDDYVRWDPPARIIRRKGRNVRLQSNMGYLSGQNPQ